MTKGVFITFEGGEGTGKSTQLRLLEKYLKGLNIPVIATREPGGTSAGELIRELLVNGKTDRWSPLTETLLHYASRYEHITNLIQPAILSGQWILCDRYTDSTFAYQGFSQGVDLKIINQLNKIVTSQLNPNLTIILDLPIEIGLKRAEKRGVDETRYEKMGIPFHQTLREAFLKIASNNPQRCVVINADEKEEVISNRIINLVNERYKLIHADNEG